MDSNIQGQYCSDEAMDSMLTQSNTDIYFNIARVIQLGNRWRRS